jgi:hypothetical protein
MRRNARSFYVPFLAGALAAGGCSGATTVPPHASASLMTAFPSRAQYGVAAHYRVYWTSADRAAAKLAALQVQTPASYLATLHAVPVPYANIRYPDGSIQRADANGAFDAAVSSYARRRRRGTSEVSVLLSASGPDTRRTAAAHIVVLSAAVEARTASGTIADDSLNGAIPDAYAFTCDPTHYMRPSVIDVPAGKNWTSPHFKAQADISYYPLFGFCGVNDSFLEASWVTGVRHWSETPETITVTQGAVLGCSDSSGHPDQATVEFTCTVRTWYVDATFYSSKPWASNSDVALWFEAWHFNALRDHSLDAHLALLRVR